MRGLHFVPTVQDMLAKSTTAPAVFATPFAISTPLRPPPKDSAARARTKAMDEESMPTCNV